MTSCVKHTKLLNSFTQFYEGCRYKMADYSAFERIILQRVLTPIPTIVLVCSRLSTQFCACLHLCKTYIDVTVPYPS